MLDISPDYNYKNANPGETGSCTFGEDEDATLFSLTLEQWFLSNRREALGKVIFQSMTGTWVMKGIRRCV